MVKGLAHLCFVVADLDKSLGFYRDTLGLRLAFDFTNEQGKRRGAYLYVGARNFLELFARAPEARSERQSYQHFCLEVTSVGEAVARLRAAGVTVTEPKVGGDGSWQAWLSDPDGNRIELHEYTPESSQEAWFRKDAGVA